MREPLLAEVYEPGRINPAGWWMSEKLDGLRAIWDPQTRRLYSRKGNVFPAPEWFTEKLPAVPLDGELWLGRNSLERTSSIVRSSEDKGWSELTYCVIDFYSRDMGVFEERQEALKKLAVAGLGPRVQVIPQTRCTGAEQLAMALDLLVGQGGEGLMLRRPGSPYCFGRSEILLKVKKWYEAEAVVTGYQDGKRSCAGVVGALLCRTPEGMDIKVGTGFDYSERKDPPPIGATITYRYTHKSKNGKPRTPSYVGIRDDL